MSLNVCVMFRIIDFEKIGKGKGVIVRSRLDVKKENLMMARRRYNQSAEKLAKLELKRQSLEKELASRLEKYQNCLAEFKDVEEEYRASGSAQQQAGYRNEVRRRAEEQKKRIEAAAGMTVDDFAIADFLEENKGKGSSG